MEMKIPEFVLDIIKKMESAGFKIYIVGGAVRDLLMQRPVNDWDFTTDATPEEILKIFPDGFYDNKFGTVGIPVEQDGWRAGEISRVDRSEVVTSEDAREKPKRQDPSTIVEITTMRKEGDYKDFRHPTEVGWTNKIEEDLARRDFTINALALRQAQGKQEIIDPYQGQEDIKAKLVRAVGDPNQRFKEDALRLMRAIRIATELEFEIEKETFSAIKSNCELIKEVAFERIRDELFKILASMYPYMGIKMLREAGILQIILPEVERCFGVQQEGEKHARVYDIGEHSLLTLKETPSTDVITRFAALIHDIGKPDTVHQNQDNTTFYNHDLVGGKLAINIAHRFNLSKKQADQLYRLCRWHLFTVDENLTDAAIRRFIKNVGVENLDEMMALRIGDRLGGGTAKPVSWRMERLQERIKQVLTKPFSVTDLKVNGKDVMEILNIPPSKKVGEILDQLFQEVLEDSSKNNREYLLEKIKLVA